MEDEQKGFYIEPKRDCPHLASFTTAINNVAAGGPCSVCSDPKENWACLTCGSRFCSRYVKGHMAEHFDKTKHPLCVSYSDFSFWCYECDSYITDKTRFSSLLKGMSAVKFGSAGTGGRYTSHATKEQMEEHEEQKEVTDAKIKQLAQMVRDSKHIIAFTGAGISTSAGIPDFRGPEGVWTLRAMGTKRKGRTVPTLSAIPTPCHMALVKLAEEDKLKYLISQNTDGIHRRSGIPTHKLSELHGNTNLEVCSKCGKEYLRDFSCSGGNKRHRTGRYCSVEGCNGALCDTVIGFGENLPLHVVQRGFEEAQQADLCLCLGSSLTVTPAADMPRLVGEKGKKERQEGEGNHSHNLVIVNLQKTPLDRLATLRIFAKCDYVMEGLMRELGLDIPPFLLRRHIVLSHDADRRVTVAAVDSDGTPVTLFVGAKATFKASGRTQKIERDDKDSDTPFIFNWKEGDGDDVNVKLFFVGHYKETPLTIAYRIHDECGSKKVVATFDPACGRWDQEVETGLDFNNVISTKGMTEEMILKKYPKKMIFDKRHPEHPLTLKPSVYHGGYRCNGCFTLGSDWVYTCPDCQYDLHPACAQDHERMSGE